MMVTTGAMRSLMEAYHDGLRNAEPTWDDISLGMIEFTRALGAASAMQAIQRGGAIIDAADVISAIRTIKPHQPRPLIDCPLCLEVM